MRNLKTRFEKATVIVGVINIVMLLVYYIWAMAITVQRGVFQMADKDVVNSLVYQTWIMPMIEIIAFSVILYLLITDKVSKKVLFIIMALVHLDCAFWTGYYNGFNVDNAGYFFVIGIVIAGAIIAVVIPTNKIVINSVFGVATALYFIRYVFSSVAFFYLWDELSTAYWGMELLKFMVGFVQPTIIRATVIMYLIWILFYKEKATAEEAEPSVAQDADVLAVEEKESVETGDTVEDAIQ